MLHRDLKPDNLLMGSSREADILFLIDYGLVKAYRHKITGKHIIFRQDKGVTGTVRYSSINIHNGMESSRRDDIESALYVLIFLFYGRLPWQDSNQQFETRNELSEYIREIKENTTPVDICGKMPEEFAMILEYSRELKFKDRPGN